MVELPQGGFAIAWASRGFDETANQAEREAHDIALLFLSADRTPIGETVWLTDTPDIDEINVHIAPYGSDQLLIVWNAVEDLNCSQLGTCFGAYAGTYFQLFTLSAEPFGLSEMISAPPTAEQNFVVYDNGDTAFAFVTYEPNYTDRVENLYGGSLPSERTVKIAHLRVWQDDNGK